MTPGRKWLMYTLLFFGLLLSAPTYSAPAKVVFLSPDDSRYWGMVSQFMASVAHDLDIELETLVDYQRHRFSYLQLAEEVLKRPEPPDYLVFMFKEHVSSRMLALAEQAGVKAFTMNTEVPANDRETLGEPRQRFAHWIGHLLTDNVDVGSHLAQLLRQQAEQRGIIDPEETLQLIALTGTADSSAALDRNRGLQLAANDYNINILQLIRADWSEQEAEAKSRVLLQRFPQTQAVWAASDGMTLGAIEALRQLGLKPGAQVITGGVDWEPRALQAIAEGAMNVSLGRHFMDGGALLILLHDYHHGFDFVDEQITPTVRYRLKAIDSETVARYTQAIDPTHWERVDFSHFSRALNPALAANPMPATALMDALTDALLDQARVPNRAQP